MHWWAAEFWAHLKEWKPLLDDLTKKLHGCSPLEASVCRYARRWCDYGWARMLHSVAYQSPLWDWQWLGLGLEPYNAWNGYECMDQNMYAFINIWLQQAIEYSHQLKVEAKISRVGECIDTGARIDLRDVIMPWLCENNCNGNALGPKLRGQLHHGIVVVSVVCPGARQETRNPCSQVGLQWCHSEDWGYESYLQVHEGLTWACEGGDNVPACAWRLPGGYM